MSSLVSYLSESRKKKVCLELGRLLDEKEIDLIIWLSKQESYELSKK
ncbi:hypothetical protein [Salipaludibacillus daqingensis]|nr:hypothetical protein [Salipaludibacillus daqingensis]